MRVRELYEQVAGLGFEKSLEDDDWFYQAANRALLQVNLLRPAISSYVINHKPMTNLVKDSSFSPVQRAEDLCYEVNDAKAYFFEADGIGTCYIERQDKNSGAWLILDAVELTGTKRFSSYSGFIRDGKKFITGRVRLRFAGDFLYSVKCVAMYQHVYSAEVSDIPAYEAYTRYDIGSLVPDLLTLALPPITEDEEYKKLSGDFDVEGGRVILLPYSATGCFKILYNRRPREIINTGGAADDETIIDLDDELCSLLPILIASYIWIEDEPDRAQYYMTLYQARAAEITAKEKNHAPVNMKDVYGW